MRKPEDKKKREMKRVNQISVLASTKRKVKIVCTMGPACWDYEKMLRVAKAGMNVARLNFSHGDYESHTRTIDTVRRVEEEIKRPIAVLLDTKGPEIRTGLLEGGNKALLAAGNRFDLRLEDDSPGNAEGVYVDHRALYKEIEVGQDIFIDDGSLHLRVEALAPDKVTCQIIVGGELGERKGVNAPDAALSVTTLTDKDVSDIHWGVEHGVNFVAVSFVRTKEDVIGVRRLLEKEECKAKVIAKIETRQSVLNIDEILDVVDGVMVARGDLGVEMLTEEVPIIQKQIIEKCRGQGKIVIVATQMLDSMIRNPRPTRAEASDVANAVLDGTDAVMLSGETASGKYPVESVEMMHKIVIRAERDFENWDKKPKSFACRNEIADAVSHGAGTIAKAVGAAAIIPLTRSGETARMVSKYRPGALIFAITPSSNTWRELSLVWGVTPYLTGMAGDLESSVSDALNILQDHDIVEAGNNVVFTSGVPLGEPGSTNMVHVHTVGKVIGRGQSLIKSKVSGIVLKYDGGPSDQKIKQGTIVIIKKGVSGSSDFVKRAAAVIMEDGGLTNPVSVATLDMGIPCIVGVKNIFDTVVNGMLVTVDGNHGLVYEGRSN